MNKEIITSKQALALIATFILGNSVILGSSREAQQDSWISGLIAIAAFIPVAFLYAKIIKLHPDMEFFDVVIKLFGTVLGKIVILFYTWFAFHLGSIVLRNFSEFVQMEELPRTPQLVFIIFMSLLSAYMVKSGIESLGKCSAVFFILYLFVLFMVTALSVNLFDFENFLPVMRQGTGKILSGAFTDFSFPLADTVLLLPIISLLRPKSSPYKVYIWGGVIGGGLLLIGLFKSILVIGFPMLGEFYFPHTEAATLIVIGGSQTDVFARLEETVSLAFVFTSFVKISVCLFTATKGLARVFNIKSYKNLAGPVSLAMLPFALLIFSNIGDMTEWIAVYRYYAFPFQVVLPALIFLTAEVRMRKQKKETTPKSA